MSLRLWPDRQPRSQNLGLRRPSKRRRFGFDRLESRELLATLFVATSGSDGGSGGVNSPFHSIQAAVNVANSGDEIRVAAGTYVYEGGADNYAPAKESYTKFLGASTVVGIVGKQLRILGGFTTSNFAVADPVNNPTIIDGQGTNRGIFVLGSGATSLDLEGVTVQNGLAQPIAKRGGLDTIYSFGGGLFADMSGAQGDASPWLISNVVFKNNKAVTNGAQGDVGGRAAGGGLELRFVVNATLDHVTFDGNQALGANGNGAGGGGLGGALHIDHSNVKGSDLIFTNNLAKSGSAPSGSGVSGNESADALGGALAVISSSQVTLTRVTATNNLALGGDASGQGGSGFGGAFYAEQSTVTLSVTDAYFQGNKAQGGNGSTGGLAGGGAIETHDATLILDRAVVVANTASGGGSAAGSFGSTGGGGLFLSRFSGAATSTITNTVIADNSLTPGLGAGEAGGGGGLWIQGSPTTLSHLTLDNNRIDARQKIGQGIIVLDGATVTLANSILSNHTGANGGAIDVLSGSLNVARALSSNNTAIISAFTKSGFSGRETILTPAGAPVLYNSPGSPRWDYHLNRKITNPAVDQSTGSTATVDLDGNPRVGVPDLGAYEAITPRIEFVTPIRVSEGGKARIVLARKGDLTDTVTVLVTINGGTGVVGTDYQQLGSNGSVSVTFAPYEATKTVELQTIDTAGINPDGKTVNLVLSIDAGSASLARLGTSQAVVSILDNDAIPSSPTGFLVSDFQLIRSAKGITGAILRFNTPLNPKAAKKLNAFALQKIAGKGKFPKVAKITYKAGSTTLTLKFTGPVKAGAMGRLVLIANRLSDTSGRTLGGTTSFTLTG